MGEAQREAGQWVLEREIGSGSFAKVWAARHRQTQQVAAVKEINLDKLSKKLQESLASEVAVLKHTQHHNIVCLLDLIKDANRLYLVLEFCAGGDLGHYLRRYRQVSEATARYFLQQVAEGLKELRRHNVIHRDLKPQNLLLSDSTSTPLLKIADFGFARSLAPQGLAETLCGSPLYMAPEILQFQKYDAKADLWSIGTILYELLVGKPPYNGANHIQLLRNIDACEARLPEHIAARLSPACRSLLGRLLQRNPVERITFEEFFAHPFLAGDDGHQGPSAGIPPPQSVAMAASIPAAAGALPGVMRQAAAAAAAAAAADARMQRAGSSSVAKPQLHLMGSVQRGQPAAHAAQSPVTGLTQQQLAPAAPAPAATVPGHSHQQQQYLQQQHQQQLQQQQQYLAGLVSQPVSHHPLAPEALQPPGDVEALSDSMEGDFVVVYTPQSSTPHTRSTSNSSSKASSGLADPKAAAVLQGTPQLLSQAGRRPWQEPQVTGVGPHQPHQLQQLQLQQQQQLQQMQQIQQQLQRQQHPGGAAASHQAGQPYGLIQVSTGASMQLGSTAAGGFGVHGSPGGAFVGMSAAGVAIGAAAGAAGIPGGSVMQHSTLQLPATPLQRVQLLVQVVRGCVSLLSRHEGPRGAGGGSGRDATGRPALQDAEQLALLLLALQVVQLLCCPGAGKGTGKLHTQQQEGAVAGGDGEGGVDCDLASVLASASQADVEQLMTAVLDLLKLAEGHTAALAEHQGSCSPTAGPADGAQGGLGHNQAASTCWGHAGVDAEVGSAAAAAAAMVGSLLQLPLPDPAGVLYHAALDCCKAAAVEEVMGNWQAALDGYSLAADLLLFLGQQWPELPAPADPGLAVHEQAALHRLYVAVNARLMAVVAEAPPLALTC